jgi:hypothetical protein
VFGILQGLWSDGLETFARRAVLRERIAARTCYICTPRPVASLSVLPHPLAIRARMYACNSHALSHPPINKDLTAGKNLFAKINGDGAYFRL